MSVLECIPILVSSAITAGLPMARTNQPGHPEVQALDLLQPVRIAGQGQAVARPQRLVEGLGRHPAGLVGVGDPLPVEGVGWPPRRPPPPARSAPPRGVPSRPWGAGRRWAVPTAVSGRISQVGGAMATKASIKWDVCTDFQPWKVDRSPTPTLTVPSPTGKIQP